MSCALVVKVLAPARQLEGSEMRGWQNALEYGTEGSGHHGEAELVEVS